MSAREDATPRAPWALLASVALACAAAACDREPPEADLTHREIVEDGVLQPETAVLGAHADTPPVGLPARELGAGEVAALCGAACSGTVCITATQRCDCLRGGEACEVGGCREDTTCGEGDAVPIVR